MELLVDGVQKYYIKATLDSGISKYDHVTKYHLGINIHPNPDKGSNNSCGVGIHLAKNLKAAKNYCSGAKEFYLAEAGVILGEDGEKIRCASINIIRKLTASELHEMEHADIPLDWYIPANPICGRDWLEHNWFKVTLDTINNQSLEISAPNHKITIKALLNRKDIRTCLAGIK